jgi:sarcosine oxidase subunit alpha
MLPGVSITFDQRTGWFLPEGLPKTVHPAGRLLGYEEPQSIEASGSLAGLKAAADGGFPVGPAIQEHETRLAGLPGPAGSVSPVCPPVKGSKTFICFDEDATLKNIDQAMDRGFDQPELVKRFAAVGTGPGQSGLPGHNLPLIVSEAAGRLDSPYPPTTRRPPLKPVLMGGLAGSNHDLCKRTPLHQSQKEQGGVMERIGAWQRARAFKADRDPTEEIQAVRNRAGMIDVSTLGCFRVSGPDALKALQRVYVGDMRKVGGQRVTYSAMVNEDGCLIDDGILVKRGPDDYYLTTSTGRAGVTAEWFRYQTRFEDWDYAIVNLTDAFGAINLAGPKSRDILQRLTDEDISNQAFPFLGYRELTLMGAVPVRAMRLGFVGELAFELHLPASMLQAVWDRLLEAGAEDGLTVFGLEAQNVLRLEKGHIIIGSESEQRTTLHDLGLGWLWSRDKGTSTTVGGPALHQTEGQSGRLKLTGFSRQPGARPPRDGCLIVDEAVRGYVCTARYSPTLNRCIGMALVESKYLQDTSQLPVFEDGAGQDRMILDVAPMPFYDPTGERMRME